MTRVVFVFCGNGCQFFSVQGHASAAEYAGRDIVCAAISSAVYLTANSVTDVLKEKADITLRDGSFTFRLKDGSSQASADMLKGLAIHLLQLAKQYPHKLKVKIFTTSTLEVRK